MKRILLAVMLGIGVLGFAQPSREKTKEIIKEQIVDKIKGYKPTDLVPYSKDGKKWALMDVKSRKILTDFILDEPSTFNPKLHFSIGIGENKSQMEILSDYKITQITHSGPVLGNTIAKKIIETTNEPGFKVDENGKIISHYSNYYNISEPILYKGAYYAMVFTKEKYCTLINQKGEEHDGFRFKNIGHLNYKDKESGDNVFFVEDFEGKRGFITISGKKKLYGEIMKGNDISALGYAIQKDHYNLNRIKKSGVIDGTIQDWLIKPQEIYRIYNILYTSSEEINIKTADDRNKATVYFLATDQSGQHFVLDVKGNPILPKK